MFVGHPGIGKGRAINPAILVARKANTVNILSDKLTIQYILEQLSKGFSAAHATALGVTFGTDTSCLISAPEMEVFLTTSDSLPSLSELWECKDGPSDYGTRGKGLVQIEKPCPSLMGGMTLRQVTDYMSTKVVSGGFTRRVNFIYASDRARALPRPYVNGSFDVRIENLVNDLRHISTLQGEIKLTTKAWELFELYYIQSTKINEFDDEVMASYSTSKWVHALKLAIILTVSKDDGLTINEDILREAIMTVENVSNDLLKVFRAVGESNLAVASERIIRFVEARGYTTRQELMGAMWRHVSSPELDIILATLETGNVIMSQERAGKTVFRIVKQPVRRVTNP